MGHVPQTNARALYDEEVTIRPLKMNNRPNRAPVLERLVKLVRQEALTAVVADSYALEDTPAAHRVILDGGTSANRRDTVVAVAYSLPY